MMSRQWNLDGPEERLLELATKIRTPLLRPMSAFERATNEPLFFNGVGHLTPRGHEIMANSLATQLDHLGLLPGR
jgi:hypothetical protein